MVVKNEQAVMLQTTLFQLYEKVHSHSITIIRSSNLYIN